ncbi:MAG: ribosome silencing factor [Treponema sp.]|nr:ribosome silencing factor [Treponema sp.]
MEDMLPGISALLKEHKGQDVTILDLRKFHAWTDFFIIATTSSSTHMNGMERHIKEFCRERDIEIFGTSSSRKNQDDDWRLLDLGFAVIHLMSKRAREFYELEKLWTPIP